MYKIRKDKSTLQKFPFKTSLHWRHIGQWFMYKRKGKENGGVTKIPTLMSFHFKIPKNKFQDIHINYLYGRENQRKLLLFSNE